MIEAIRIGKISKVDPDKGMASVVYEDQEDAVTGMLPILRPFMKIVCPEGGKLVFCEPKVGEYVVVAHLANGMTRGVILGSYYNETNQP